MKSITLTFSTETELTAAELELLASRIGEAGNRELLRYRPAAGRTKAVQYVLVTPSPKS